MNRRECLERLAEWVDDTAVVASSISTNTSLWSRLRPTGANFFGLNLGLCIGLGTGLAFAFPRSTVIALDSDGSAMVDASAFITLADAAPPNFVGIIMDNEAYARMGTTATSRRTDLAAMAKAAGVPNTATIRTIQEFEQTVRPALTQPGPSIFVVKIEAETVRVRPSGEVPTAGTAMKDRFMEAARRHPQFKQWREAAASA
jgi:thiamine pyrophosphate-dependent acetolactate synthase large subunit-like protein